MGNTVIVKPPKLSLLLYGPLLQAFRDAFPAGVVQNPAIILPDADLDVLR